MKSKYLAIVGFGLMFTQMQYAAAADSNAELKTEQDKVSYTIGVDMGENFRAQGIEINSDILALGINDGVAGGETLLTTEQMEETLLNFQQDLLMQREEKLKEIADKNLAVGNDFLAKNKQQPGVVTLPSGLQYKVIKKGTGESPTAEDMVTVNYTGYLVDPTKKDGMGDVFDSSEERNEPVTFPVSGVIPGWTEALQMMKTGAEWYIYVPTNLAYGENAVGPIGPNEALIFKIDLLSVKSPDADDNSGSSGQSDLSKNS